MGMTRDWRVAVCRVDLTRYDTDWHVAVAVKGMALTGMSKRKGGAWVGMSQWDRADKDRLVAR